MAIQVEIWQNDIIENLYKDNEFMRLAFNADQYVIGGKIVHIPTAGAKPSVVKNRTKLPAATITQRTDSEILYQIDEFTTDPILIENAETVELSYDKRQNILYDHNMVLKELVSDWMIRNWFSYTMNGDTKTAQIIRTTGDDVAAHLPSATGNRKLFVKEDLKKARTLMNKNNIPREGRYALIDSDMMDQLQEDPDLKKRDTAMELDLKNGVIARLYGFNLIDRSSVGVFSNAATPVVKDPGATAAATDNGAVLCWQQGCVERALGTVKFFESLDEPTMYGDVYSALVRHGGRLRRPEGVVAIVQAAGA